MKRFAGILYDLVLVATLVVTLGAVLASSEMYRGTLPLGGPFGDLLLSMKDFTAQLVALTAVLLWGRGRLQNGKLPELAPKPRASVRIFGTAHLGGINRDAPDALQKVRRILEDQSIDPGAEVIDLLDDMILMAQQMEASDIHIEPQEDSIRVTYRLDGEMRDVATLPKRVELRLINRLRIISKMDITRSDSPQDGRVEDTIRGQQLNIRVSVFPTHHGSKAVIRLLDLGTHKLPQLSELGIQPATLERFRLLLRAPQGLILITGPTGSGKTTLMYAALSEVIQEATEHHTRKNIVTLEDPIERIIANANQTQVDVKRGLSFASGLRTLLRQDPNVMMVGEIRDLETAQIAIQAGQTGHLLLTTLHTNSSSAAFGRLIDMGIEPFLLTASISGIVAIRLVRRICPNCRVERTPPAALLERLKLNGAERKFFEGKGCDACNKSGFQGRLALFELLTMNDEVANVVIRKGSLQEIVKAARTKGMVTIQQDGMSKVFNGQTSLNELLRVVQEQQS